MVHILVVILKFIGIVLAAVLGLLLFLFLLFMFAPIRYHLDGQAGDHIHVEGRVSWLFFVLRCKIKYDSEEGTNWFFRIFGVLAASNEENFVARKESRKAKKEAKKAKKNRKMAEEKREIEQMAQDMSEEELIQDIFEESDGQEMPEEDSSQNMPEEMADEMPAEEWMPAKDSEQPSKVQKTSVLEKIKRVYTEAKNFFVNMKKKITAIPKKIRNIKNKFEKTIERIQEIKEFFVGEQNKEVIKYILGVLKKMTLHLLPNKFQGRVEFGLEDPYTMGQILALLGMLMPIYQDKLVVIPDFEEQKCKGEVSLSGTIIPGYMIFWLLRLILNKEVRRIIKDGKTLIGGNI